MSAGKAIWKLDDPAVLAAERAERQAAAAEAARRKLANALDKKVGQGSLFWLLLCYMTRYSVDVVVLAKCCTAAMLLATRALFCCVMRGQVQCCLGPGYGAYEWGVESVRFSNTCLSRTSLVLCCHTG
jgi:hypothetical protein